MANIIGPGRQKALETRRSPYDPGHLFCKACTAKRRKLGFKGFVIVRKVRVLVDGLMRPGVQCPQCLTAWYEQEEQPEKPH